MISFQKTHTLISLNIHVHMLHSRYYNMHLGYDLGLHLQYNYFIMSYIDINVIGISTLPSCSVVAKIHTLKKYKNGKISFFLNIVITPS